MRYRQLGRWGVKVSVVGLGSWLTYGGAVEEETAAACIRCAYERGITFFDTANVYARGRAEEVVGRAIAQFRRDSIVLATKVYFPMGDGPNDGGLGRKHSSAGIRSAGSPSTISISTSATATIARRRSRRRAPQ